MHSYAKAPTKSLPNAICYYTGNEQTADKVMHLSAESLFRFIRQVQKLG